MAATAAQCRWAVLGHEHFCFCYRPDGLSYMALERGFARGRGPFGHEGPLGTRVLVRESDDMPKAGTQSLQSLTPEFVQPVDLTSFCQ